jgi:hypothetical protein
LAVFYPFGHPSPHASVTVPPDRENLFQTSKLYYGFVQKEYDKRLQAWPYFMGYPGGSNTEILNLPCGWPTTERPL